jgi:hypothetical protein
LCFTELTFIIKGKIDTYNTNSSSSADKMRYSAVKVYPLSHQAENKMLLRRMQKYATMKQQQY